MSDRENKKHSFLRTIGTVAAAGTAAYGGFSWHLFNKLFDLERNSLHSVSLRQDGDEEAVNRWLVQAKRTDAYLQSFDGLTLHAIVITNHSEGHRWVLLAHGFGQSAMDMAATTFLPLTKEDAAAAVAVIAGWAGWSTTM